MLFILTSLWGRSDVKYQHLILFNRHIRKELPAIVINLGMMGSLKPLELITKQV